MGGERDFARRAQFWEESAILFWLGILLLICLYLVLREVCYAQDAPGEDIRSVVKPQTKPSTDIDATLLDYEISLAEHADLSSPDPTKHPSPLETTHRESQ
jgi:hypothetical protein